MTNASSHKSIVPTVKYVINYRSREFPNSYSEVHFYGVKYRALGPDDMG